MARLYEHQGKDLLAASGIAIPRGRVVTSPEQAASAAREIGGPVVLKVQVLAGKRGKAGGVRSATSPAEAAKIAEALLSLPFGGARVEKLLVEEKLTVQREAYAAVTADPTARQPVVLFSLAGGGDVEEQAGAVVTVPVDILQGLPDYAARNIVRRASGATGADIILFAPLLVSLYRVYRAYDCKLAEINPVAVTSAGLVAADARLDIDEDALFRHPTLPLAAGEEVGDRPPTPLEIAAAQIDRGDHRGTAHFVQLYLEGTAVEAEGKVPIALDCVGTGASLTLMDELLPLGYSPVNFADTSGNPPASKMYRATKVILSQPKIRGYIFLSCISSQQLDNTARGIIAALRDLYPATGGQPNIPMLFVFRGAWDAEALQLFHEHGIARFPHVRLLGRDVTEAEAAAAFHQLYTSWVERRPR